MSSHLPTERVSANRTQGLLTRVGRQASTGEVSVVAHFEVRVDRIVVSQLDHLLESVVDEDEADQRGEAFFRETSEVLNQEAGIGGHQKETQEGRPQANPKTKLQVVKIMVPRKKTKQNKKNRYFDYSTRNQDESKNHSNAQRMAAKRSPSDTAYKARFYPGNSKLKDLIYLILSCYL